MVNISKLNSTQIENIKQILTLRYSTNLENNSTKLHPENFISKTIENPEHILEQSISQKIFSELKTSDGKIGISLSSGVDSTLVLAILRKEFPENNIESLSIKFSESVDETEASKKISEKFETNHHILEINNFLEELPKAISIVKQPFWDLHWYYLVKRMKKFTNIFLSGDGGDELFGGYTFRYKKFLDSTNKNSTTNEKILAYLNCHERDWVPDQELIFDENFKFNWQQIYKILQPYFDNSLPNLTQVFLADYNGKLLHNMQPLYSSIHEYFDIQNVSPILNKESIKLSCQIPNSLKYNHESNLGKPLLGNLIEKFGISDLISSKKQGFSVNTINMWNSYGKEIFDFYFDKSRLIEDKIINPFWIKKYSQNLDLDVRYVNKLFGLLALEIWYRIFFSNDLNPNEKLEI